MIDSLLPARKRHFYTSFQMGCGASTVISSAKRRKMRRDEKGSLTKIKVNEVRRDSRQLGTNNNNNNKKYRSSKATSPAPNRGSPSSSIDLSPDIIFDEEHRNKDRILRVRSAEKKRVDYQLTKMIEGRHRTTLMSENCV